MVAVDIRHVVNNLFWNKENLKQNLRYYIRQYNNNKSTKRFKIDDPREFWKLLNNLGPKHVKKDCIPIWVISRDGKVTHNSSEMLDIWKNTFATLFSGVYDGHKARELPIFTFAPMRWIIC